MKYSVNASEEWIGKKIAKLTILEILHEDKRGVFMWRCKCDCGKEIMVHPANLKMGRVHSCGCLQKEKATTHGHHGTRIYTIWIDMRRRCNDPRVANYKNYGGRGIKLYQGWNEFMPFYDWSMAHGYADDLSIDRIDVNGNYSPTNCRWVDLKTQARNKRTNSYFTVFGERMCLAEAIERYGNGIHSDTVWRRIHRYGYSVEDALTKPVRSYPTRKKCENNDVL